MEEEQMDAQEQVDQAKPTEQSAWRMPTMRTMRYSMVMVLLMVLLMVAQVSAGWFGFGKAKAKDEVHELKPALGYVERTTVETNAWGTCVRNHKRGVVTEQISNALTGSITGVGYDAICCTNACITGMVYYKCTKAHVDDWPKTTTKVQGIQSKTTTEIYKDGMHISTITEYAYPYRKITMITKVWIEYKNNTKTVIEDVTK